MYFDLWTFFVEYLFGGFWIAVFGIAALLFMIMSVFGRMSRMSAINYLLIYFLTMTIGWGYRWLTVLIGMAIVVWLYLEIKNYTGG